MITITSYTATPRVACGGLARFRVVVSYAGPRRTVTVSLSIPGGPCSLSSGTPSQTRTENSPVTFEFTERIDCPAPQDIALAVRADATDDQGSSTHRSRNVRVQC